MMTDDKLESLSGKLTTVLLGAAKQFDPDNDPGNLIAICGHIVVNVMEHIHRNTDLDGIATLRYIANSLLHTADQLEAMGEIDWTTEPMKGHA